MSEDMQLYEFITPSDPITFYAPDDEVATAVAVFVGRGQAGCVNVQTEKHLDTVMIFLAPAEADKRAHVAVDIVKTRTQECLSAAKTFAVCGPSGREIYDDYTENGTNAEKVAKWDDKKRSSLNDWCGYARGLQVKEEAQP